jgi:hypothetical protein
MTFAFDFFLIFFRRTMEITCLYEAESPDIVEELKALRFSKS